MEFKDVVKHLEKKKEISDKVIIDLQSANKNLELKVKETSEKIEESLSVESKHQLVEKH